MEREELGHIYIEFLPDGGVIIPGTAPYEQSKLRRKML